MGQSLGSAVASRLASTQSSVGMLVDYSQQILISPIESIIRVVEDKVGKLLSKLASAVIKKNRFDNSKAYSLIEHPTLIIHGSKDKIAKVGHSFNIMGRIGFMQTVCHTADSSD